MLKRLEPGVALLFIAPVLGELVSGHQSPIEFFNPIVFVVLALPYGCGALLVREFTRRWGTGWRGLALLGAAFALYEEGIVSRALFNPAWHEATALAGFDNVAGINLTYGTMLVHFHVTISIAASIVIAELLYPARRVESWLPNRYAALCAVVLALWAPTLELLARAEQPLYVPPPHLWFATVAALCILVTAARFVRPISIRRRRVVPSPRHFYLLGAINTTVVLATVLIAPESGLRIPLLVSVPALIVFDVASLALILRWSGNAKSWDDRHRLALVAGWLTFFLVVNALGDTERFVGRIFVSVAAAVVLVRLWRRVNRTILNDQGMALRQERKD